LSWCRAVDYAFIPRPARSDAANPPKIFEQVAEIAPEDFLASA
jgi:hypothetical protein